MPDKAELTLKVLIMTELFIKGTNYDTVFHKRY